VLSALSLHEDCGRKLRSNAGQQLPLQAELRCVFLDDRVCWF
jgi:hypothetical protein